MPILNDASVSDAIDVGGDEIDRLSLPLDLFEASGEMTSEVQVRDDGLTGTAWGEPLDSARHMLAHEVKAITYHELKVVRDGDGWLAEVIVDI